MEPPAKRLRHGSSPFKRLAEIDDEPDELHSASPHHDDRQDEATAQVPDDGYHLASKRHQANQRLEATFAHIIEKYSHNFDGIGDEIDMETGEIVVNNGHLNSMRHEGDLGGGWTGDIEGDEDDGFLLEDFLEDFSDDDQEQNSTQTDPDVVGGDDSSKESHNDVDKNENMNENKDEEKNQGRNDSHAALEETQPSINSGVMVPASGLGVGGPGMVENFQGCQPGSLAAFLPNPYGNMFMGLIPAFGPLSSEIVPQMMNGAVPFHDAYLGNSSVPLQEQCAFPLMINPWAMAGLLPPQAWAQPSPSMQLPQALAQPSSPLQDQMTPMPLSEKSNAKRYKFPVQKGRTSIWAPSSRQDRDDMPTPKTNKRGLGRPPGVRGHTRPNSSPLNTRADTSDNYTAQSENSDHENRRKSGRVRKQTEYMGKVPWSEADRIADSSQETSGSKMSGLGLENKIDTDTVDELAMDEVETTPRSSQTSIRLARTKSMASLGLGRVIPDSQDSETQPTSSAPRSSLQSKEHDTDTNDTVPAASLHKDTPSMALSDDEAPLFLPGRTETAVLPTSVEPPADVLEPESTANMGVHQQPGPSTTPGHRKRRRHSSPEQSHDDTPAEPESMTVQPSPGPNGQQLVPLEGEMNKPRDTFPSSPRSMLAPDLNKVNHEQSTPSRIPAASKHTTAKLRETMLESPPKRGVKQTPSKSLTADSKLDITPGHMANTAAPQLATTEPAASPPSTIPATEDGASTDGAEDPQQLPVQKDSPAPSPNPRTGNSLSNNSPNTPKKPKHVQSQSPKPHTPRNTAIRTSHAPSSRRSLLSLVSNNNSDSESEDDIDELNRAYPSPFQRSAGASTIKTWRSSALTREVFRTPVKRRPKDPVSPGSVVKTPGGTLRACGVDGFRCGRDFCFNCL
ncbi:hypothetical protein BGZ63DRAFT_398955 [Mariannaea sp. PMI_226]|nr:hypothetical protein BGZ63DRAFT_398955 [Mariannaea sp. PMI_226]